MGVLIMRVTSSETVPLTPTALFPMVADSVLCYTSVKNLSTAQKDLENRRPWLFISTASVTVFTEVLPVLTDIARLTEPHRLLPRSLLRSMAQMEPPIEGVL